MHVHDNDQCDFAVDLPSGMKQHGRIPITRLASDVPIPKQPGVSQVQYLRLVDDSPCWTRNYAVLLNHATTTDTPADWTLEVDDPKNLKQALARPDGPLWKEAIASELESLASKGVYTEMELPPGRTALPSKWVFEIKRDAYGKIDRYKARFVAKGFLQRYGRDYDEVFAPTCSPVTLRVLLSIAAQQDLEIEQLDIKTAFLNGELPGEVYMRCPPGFESKNKVWRLHKAIYGLKQAALTWYDTMKKSLLAKGFSVGDSDPCLFMAELEGSKVLMVVHVDDCLIVAAPSAMAATKRIINSLYEMKDLGPAHCFLGLEIVRDRNNRRLWLGQTGFIQAALHTYGMEDCNSRVAPMDAGTQLTSEGDPLGEEVPYRALIGTLLYISTKTRPDIAHAVGMLARFCQQPTTLHWNVAKSVLRYLAGTRSLGLLFHDQGSPLPHGYSDADYGGDRVDKKSTSGYVFLHGGAAVAWLSKKQGPVATSTCEAEFIAGAFAVKEALFLSKLFADITGLWQPVTLRMDNQSALVVLRNPAAGAQNKMKHVDIAYNFARHRVMVGDVSVEYVPTADMVADSLTKQLPGPGHIKHRRGMGLAPNPSGTVRPSEGSVGGSDGRMACLAARARPRCLR
jgi:hypothetical protein